MYKEELRYTWKEFVTDCLAYNKKKYKADAVIAIMNGGYYPGAMVAAMYKVPLYMVSASSYKDKKQGKLVIGSIPKNLAGKRVLVVDDIIDTGRTMRGVTSKLHEGDIAVEDILVVFKRYGISFQGKSFRRAKKSVWVKFPWEERQYEISAIL